MTVPFTDLTGRVIPPDRVANVGSIDRLIAVPPVRDVPNEQAIEFTMFAYAQLAAGGTGYIQLTDFDTGAPFSKIVPQDYRGRFESLLLFCPDMVTAAAPYLSFSMNINKAPANAWSNMPVYPRNGVASPGFGMVTDLQPQAVIELYGRNTDPLNAHFLGVYLYGWYWPKDLQQQ